MIINGNFVMFCGGVKVLFLLFVGHCFLVLFEIYFSCAKVNEEKLFTINYSFNKRDIFDIIFIYFY